MLILNFLAASFTTPAFCLEGAPANSSDSGNDHGAAPLIEKITAGQAFSFVYDGKRSQDILPHWRRSESVKALSGGRKLRVTTYRDPATGLEVTSEIITFSEAPAVDCILRLRNTGTRDTPIIENLLPLDLKFIPPGAGKILMHYANGSVGRVEDFLPIDKEVVTGSEIDMVHYVMKGDAQVDSQAPYFNLERSGGGLIGAVGWSGQWAVHVSGENEGEVALRAGQQKTHLLLHPGESIRTPRMLLLQWKGNDRFVGHNQLRKLLLAHYVFRHDGQIALPPVSDGYAYGLLYDAFAKATGRDPLVEAVAAGSNPDRAKEFTAFAGDISASLNSVNEQNQLDLIRHTDSAGIEAYWLDAGWFEGGWPAGAGSWIPDPKKFPHGMKPIGDASHAKGLKFILWFEPGRATQTSRIAIEHPEWVLHHSGDEWGGLFNLGDPAALHQMTEDLSAKIDAWGVDIYRNDSNICPVPFWRTADALDRQGITENHWVEGLYAMWDGLLRAHPKLVIDNANWRITGPDIEAMSRSVGSLTRSESDVSGFPHSAAAQIETESLSLWAPINAGIINGFDPYVFRSEATTGLYTGVDLHAPYVPLDQVKAGIAELKSLRPYWLGDYYPLTEINLDEHAWAGWEFYRPDVNAGFAVLFRRSLSTEPSFEAALRGLNPAANYDVTFARTYEVGEKRTMTGKQLKHLRVDIDTAPGSVLIRFKKAGRRP